MEGKALDSLHLSEGATPRALVLGPGYSKVDTLYALRFLDLLGVPGEIFVYDDVGYGDILGKSFFYHLNLPVKPHRCQMNLDLYEGDYENLHGANAHVAFLLHPNRSYSSLVPVLSRNLVGGAIVFWQHDYDFEDCREQTDPREHVSGMVRQILDRVKNDFEVIDQWREPLFTTECALSRAEQVKPIRGFLLKRRYGETAYQSSLSFMDKGEGGQGPGSVLGG